MTKPPRYRSSIPNNAEERVLETDADGNKQHAEYWLDGRLVGRRRFFDNGEPASETPLRDGRSHGMYYDWNAPGVLQSAIPYANGLEHGTAHQWNFDGTYLGSYTMQHGTGIDLWRSACADGTSSALSEVRYYRDGRRHGFEWWICSDQRSVWEESHYVNGEAHGMLRQWNRHNKLRRGYPHYYIKGQRVTKRQYVRATLHDPSLPPFSLADNFPARVFPPEVAQHLGSGEPEDSAT